MILYADHDFKDVKQVDCRIANQLMKELHEKDSATYHHCNRVKDISIILGDTIGLNGKELNLLAESALLHDIGKIAIDEAILNKPGALSIEEWNVMKKHPSYGELMLTEYKLENEENVVGELIRHHHEHFNGKGYPYGLIGEDIPFLSRIISVVDVFEALTSKRPYREPCSIDDAVWIMDELSGNQLDPWLTEIFIHKVLKY